MRRISITLKPGDRLQWGRGFLGPGNADAPGDRAEEQGIISMGPGLFRPRKCVANTYFGNSLTNLNGAGAF